ncbi:winged helix-turn-helix transcriptional regulator [Pseudomonas sp. CHM02]|uniref:winged helix-turn-helix transcriptional regulator n=1 Tax=Pseudomonas sp. CHM02 TaxID=1463662 RepID=UPI000471C207|nr:helix-turn-helix domain-containing protein [Pseudomonas sp. CHM02]
MTKLRNYDSAPGCSMEAVLHIIGGKWKGVILYHLLLDGTHRFNELQRQLTGIPPRLLVKQLRDLEEDGLVVRTVYAVVPPKVEYSLSEEGRSLEPFLMGLSTWGKGWLERRGMTIPEEKIRATAVGN